MNNVRSYLNNHPKVFIISSIALMVFLLGLGIYFAFALVDYMVWPFLQLCLICILIGVIASRLVLFMSRQNAKKNENKAA